MTRLLLLCALTLGLVTSVPEASAKRDTPAQKAKKKASKKANQHFKRALKFAAEERHEEALAEFEKAYELAPHPLVLFNIAGAHRQLQHYREALNTYSRFLLEGDGSVKPELLRRGKADMDELLSLVARVSVESEPSGAILVVDGEEVGELPLTERLVLPPGTHVFEATLGDDAPVMRTLTLTAGDEIELMLAMKPANTTEKSPEVIAPKPKASPPPKATLRRFGVSATFGMDTRRFGDTGAPTIGVAYAFTDRLSLGLDVVLVAYSVIPQLRYRLFGDALSAHLILAAPVSRSDVDDKFFVAGAGGAGLRLGIGEHLALRLEVLASYAGGDRGLTIPAFAGGEYWF